MQGTTGTTFSPGRTSNRGQIAAILSENNRPRKTGAVRSALEKARSRKEE